jgi:hypothetical protein
MPPTCLLPFRLAARLAIAVWTTTLPTCHLPANPHLNALSVYSSIFHKVTSDRSLGWQTLGGHMRV